MLQAIISVIRLLIDPQLRTAVAAARASAANSGEAWTKKIGRSRAKFRGDEEHLVAVFAHTLRENFTALGISGIAIDRFTTVFDELVRNAFRHGCEGKPHEKVVVTCDYSRWFIRLRVADSGRGFPFAVYRSAAEYQQHGLGIVSKLTTRFESNDKGNVITAMVGGHDALTVEVGVSSSDETILYLTASNQELWHYSRENWEPLLEAIDGSGKNLVFLDCRTMRWSSDRARDTKEVLTAFNTQAGRRVAFIVDAKALRIFDFSHLNSENSRVFQQQQHEQARGWLLTG
jgi:anti-sigma regulatory factor (Ser/Thr protein kinase)